MGVEEMRERACSQCGREAHTEEHRRVLIVHANLGEGLELALKWTARGAEAVVVTSARQAYQASGPFDRGIFSLELSDGSGIALAAAMIACERIDEVEFLAESRKPRHFSEPRFAQTPEVFHA